MVQESIRDSRLPGSDAGPRGAPSLPLPCCCRTVPAPQPAAAAAALSTEA